MPQVEFSKKDFEQLMDFEVDDAQLETYFLPAKCELDEYKEGIIKLKATDTNRPDLWSVEGVARELKAHLGLDKGLLNYKFGKSDYTVEVSGKNDFNPKEASAIIRDVNVTEDLLISMINFQEKICNSFGSRRSEFALGIYALNKVNGKKLKYTVVDKKTKFCPLGFDKEITLEDVLKIHPKGKEFAHLLQGMNKYPVWVDEKGKIMSMPPIVNSNESGKVELGKQDLFLEVTGKTQEKVDLVLLLCALAFADRGAKVESIVVEYKEENKKIVSLDTTPGQMILSKEKIFEYLGEKIDNETIKRLLEQKHFDVKIVGSDVVVKYPKYRQDILHTVDIIEDLIIEFGYNVLKPEKLKFHTVGGLLQSTEWNQLVKESCIGLGLQEIVTFTLTSAKKQYNFLGLKPENCVEIANPMSDTIAIFREKILSENLEFLAKNQHISYPQNTFELGKVAYVPQDKKQEKAIEENHLCVCLCHNEVTYTEAKQYLDFVLKNIGAEEIKFTAQDYVFCISKRSAKVSFKLANKMCEGFIGELSPQTLSNFGLNMPVACFEICVDKY